MARRLPTRIAVPSPPKTDVRCPYCKEERQIEIEGYKGFCNTCGRTFAVPISHKFDVSGQGK